MRLAGRLLAAALLLAASPALACTPAPGWPDEAEFDFDRIAHEMATAATFIDLATVVATKPSQDALVRAEARRLAEAGTDAERDEIRREYADQRTAWTADGLRATYRIVERLKGEPGGEFTLNGERMFMDLPMGENPLPLSTLRHFVDQRDLADREGLGECATPLFISEGATYLVFRDTDGGLLYEPVAVRFDSRWVSVDGPAHVPIAGESDPWLKTVRKALEQ